MNRQGWAFRRFLYVAAAWRRAVPYPGTPLYETHGPHRPVKHQSMYADWIEQVRREIDLPMLRSLTSEVLAPTE
jgi:radical SAM superfamily enzyme with C-terminal helix-hairpin-helix motif